MNITTGKLFGTVDQRKPVIEGKASRLPECSISAVKCCRNKLARKVNIRSGI